MPLDKQSIVATAPGLPWWGVVLLGAGLTTLGFLVDAARGSELTAVFSTLYFLGCVIAGAAASNRALFTAMVQPPLILFVAIPIAQSFVGNGIGSGIKNIAFNVALPLVNRFPVMLGATVVVLAICGARLFLLQQRRNGPARTSERRRTPRSDGESTSRRTSQRSRARTARSRDDEPAPRSRPAPRRGTPSRRASREPIETPRRRAGLADDLPPRPRRTVPAPSEAPQRPRPRPRPTSEVPAHPIPQVRYRDRHEPPFESERP